MIDPKSPFSFQTTYVRSVEIKDAIVELEMHLLTAISAKAHEEFINGMERSISILKELGRPIDLEDDDEEE